MPWIGGINVLPGALVAYNQLRYPTKADLEARIREKAQLYWMRPEAYKKKDGVPWTPERRDQAFYGEGIETGHYERKRCRPPGCRQEMCPLLLRWLLAGILVHCRRNQHHGRSWRRCVEAFVRATHGSSTVPQALQELIESKRLPNQWRTPWYSVDLYLRCRRTTVANLELVERIEVFSFNEAYTGHR